MVISYKLKNFAKSMLFESVDSESDKESESLSKSEPTVIINSSTVFSTRHLSTNTHFQCFLYVSYIRTLENIENEY